jgi:hypothetical protein
MTALRGEVRMAVLKIKALAKIAWNSEAWPKRVEGNLAPGEADAGLGSDAEIAGSAVWGGEREAFGGETAAQQLADGGGPARHVRGEAPAVERFQLAGRQHDLEPLLPAVHAHDT